MSLTADHQSDIELLTDSDTIEHPLDDALGDEVIDRIQRMSIYTPSWIYSTRSRSGWLESSTEEREQGGNRGDSATSHGI